MTLHLPESSLKWVLQRANGKARRQILSSQSSRLAKLALNRTISQTQASLRDVLFLPALWNICILIGSDVAIVLPTQTLHTSAPSASSLISTHLSHLHSHSASQRSEHLSALSTALQNNPNSSLPISSSTLLAKLNPLISDLDHNVRSQLPKLYALIPVSDLEADAGTIILFVRAGMTHLRADIKSSSLDLLAWMLGHGDLGTEIVSAAGGWVKTLKVFMILLGWKVIPPPSSISAPSNGVVSNERQQQGGWTEVSGGMDSTKGIQAKVLKTLTLFLRCGLQNPPTMEWKSKWPFPLHNVEAHLLPTRPNAYEHLNLFGPRRDEEGQMYTDVEGRKRVLNKLGYSDAIAKGVESLRKEGGEAGRAAGALNKLMRELNGD